MSPTARNQSCENLQDDVFPIMRTSKLEASELQALFGEDRDYTCSPTVEEQHTEEEKQLGDEYTTDESVSEFTYLAGQSSNTPSPKQTYRRTHLHRDVFFRNEAYYSKLEELKRNHLQNIADLQRLYLHQLPASSEQTDRLVYHHSSEHTDSEQVASRHQPNINPNQSLIHSDQSDASVDEQVSEDEWENTPRSTDTEQAPPTNPRWGPLPKGSSSFTLANQQPRRTQRAKTQRRGSNVTVPQPFQMMLREEERKLRRVKTRSEVELENERLRKELDELKECGRKFRATPAPASTHLPPFEVIGMRHCQRQPAKGHHDPRGHHGTRRVREKPSRGRRSQDKMSSVQQFQNKPSPGRCLQDKSSSKHHLQKNSSSKHRLQSNRHKAPPLPQQPFSFIERERKKKELKLQAELNNMTPREERHVFKARPVPKSLYRNSLQDYQLYGEISLHSRVQEHQTAPPGCLEESFPEEEFNEEEDKEEDELLSSNRGWGVRKQSTEKVKKETEKRRSGERERDWSYIQPLNRGSVSCCQEVPAACKPDYISV